VREDVEAAAAAYLDIGPMEPRAMFEHLHAVPTRDVDRDCAILEGQGDG
jgi:hypothetical protein